MSRRILLALLFFSSGFASLVDEVLFSRLLQFSFGVSIFATTAVVAAFLAGLGLGALVLAAPSRKARRPTLVYGLLEVGVGLVVPLFPLAAKGLTPQIASLFSGLEPNSFAFGIARFGAAFGILLIPSFLMGGTLPFLVRAAVNEESPRRASGVGFFYGINTLGAGLGALLSGYLFLPALGYGKTVLLSAGVSVGVGVAAIALGWREDRLPAAAGGDRAEPIVPAPEGDRTPSPNAGRAIMAAAVGLGGCISLSYQILWTRVLINVFGGSVYAFSLVLALFLGALALGSVILPALLSRGRNPLRSLALLFALSAAAAGLGILIFRAWLGLDGPLGDAYNLYPEMGETFATTFFTYAALAGIAVGPSVFFLGAVLPFAAGIWARKGTLSRFTGRLYALSSLGSIAGCLAGAFLLLPVLSAEGGIMAGAGLSLAIGAALWLSARHGRGRNLLAAGGVGLVCASLLVASALWRPGSESTVKTVYFEEGPAATAKVESFLNDDGDTILSLRVNGKVVATTGFLDRRLQLLLGYCATFSHRDPQKILSVGLGTGMSSGALAAHGPARFEIVELSRSVVGAAGEFGEHNHDITRQGATLVLADGRNHLLLTDDRYDLIAADPIHPWVAGSGNLYTVEYFRLAASRLAEGGVMGQWVPLYQLTACDVRSVLATFHAVFDHVRVFYTGYDLVVVGSRSPLFFDPLEWKRRCRAPIVADDLASIGIRDLEDLLACFLFTENGLGRFLEMGEFKVNRDANQTLEYSAPMSLWRPYDTALIMELLDAAEGVHALAPADRWPLGVDLTAFERQASYADTVRAFFDEIARNRPGARKRFRERIADL